MRKLMHIGTMMAIILFGIWNAQATPPQLIRYEGRLMDGTNVFNGDISMVLSFFDAETAGTQLLEDSNTVTVVDGFYSTFIGDDLDPAFDTLANALTNTEVWLDITIDGTPVTPRDRVASVAYAIEAGRVGNSAILSGMLADDSVTTDKIADQAITTSLLADNAITSNKINNNSIASDKIKDGSVLIKDLSPNSFWETTTISSNIYSEKNTERCLEIRANEIPVIFAESVIINWHNEYYTNTRVRIGHENQFLTDEYGSSWDTFIAGRKNTIGARGYSSTIGGGRENYINTYYGTIAGGLNNTALDSYTTIGGGYKNLNSSNSFGSTIAGGRFNSISGNSADSSIGGGNHNQISNTAATISGGAYNSTKGYAASILGGDSNTAEGNYSVIAGGRHNTAIGFDAFIGGGWNNTNISDGGVISGGSWNIIEGESEYYYLSTIGGGGGNQCHSTTYTTISGGVNNQCLDTYYAVIGGGGYNEIRYVSSYSTISGGYTNTMRGFYNVIGGGAKNSIISSKSTIGGGDSNKAIADLSTISGGHSNTTEGQYSTIGGGSGNYARGFYGCISGGRLNWTDDNWDITIGGGFNNHCYGPASTIAGGSYNTVDGHFSIVSGGGGNTCSNTYYSNIAGGENQLVSRAAYSIIGGGYENQILVTTTSVVFVAQQYEDVGAMGITIAGGRYNRATKNDATIGGGASNEALEDATTIAGGSYNNATYWGATIGGGETNTSSGLDSVVSGGRNNTASGHLSMVPGGIDNVASGPLSFAAGRYAMAQHQGSFVWADSLNAPFKSITENSFMARCRGGVAFITGTDTQGRFRSGVYLLPGAGNWSTLSDRNSKDNFKMVNEKEILEKIADMPITTWNWKTQDKGIRHLGPMAQDFHAAFGLGSSEKHINATDIDGIALAAIKGLYQEVQEKDSRIEMLEERIARLEAALGE